MFEERPVLGTIDQGLDGDRVTVSVTLAFGGETRSGRVEGSVEPQQRPRLVGEATLRAIEALVENRRSFDLSAVATTDLGPVRIALAQVRESGSSEYLIGSALVRDGDAAAATAKAVLDALNRRIARIV